MKNFKRGFAQNLKSIKSLISVGLIQGINFLFPAATLPFLIRYLGPADYGLFNLSQTWAIYFSVIIAYGFDLSATKEVAAGINDHTKLNRIFSKVLFSKLFLFVLSLLAFCVIIVSNEKLREHFLIYILMFLWTLNTVFFQSWLYLGMEKQRIVSLFFLISRAGSFLIILVLIYFKCPFLVLVLAYSIPQAAAAIISHFQTTKRFGIKLHVVPYLEILKYLKSSFVLFLSTIAGTITITLSVILLGFLSTKESVGYFAVASKLVSVMYGIVLFPFQIVFFPIIVRNVKESYDSGIRYFVKVLMGSLAIMGLCCGIIYLYSPFVIKIFGGKNFGPSIKCLRIVCFIPFLALADTLFGFLLVALNKSLTYTIFLLIGTAICFLLNLIFIPTSGATGASFAWLLAEFSCFLCFSMSFLRKDFSLVYGLNTVYLKTINTISFYGSKISGKRKVS